MWYAIQTVSGQENKVVEIVKKISPPELLNDIYFLRYENVWRKQGTSNISVETMFKGYVFVNTEDIEELYYWLKKSPMFVTLISDNNRDDVISFLKLSDEEVDFLNELIHGDEEKIMRLSYIHRNSQNRIDFAEGPLEKFVDKIYSVDYSHRRVFINVMLLGSLRSIKFGIKTDDDITENERINKWNNRLKRIKSIQPADTGDIKTDKSPECDIRPGSLVYDLTGIYGEEPLIVKSVDIKKSRIVVEAEMFQMKIDVELPLNEVVVAK